MKKKNHTPFGTLFSPELREITRRLKSREPELDEMLNREGAKDLPDDLGTDYAEPDEKPPEIA